MFMNQAVAIWATIFCFVLATGYVVAEPLAEVEAEEPKEIQVVNINEADATVIAETLEGIGLKRAEAIVNYRSQYGRFYSAEELSAVQGIGMKTIQRNLKRIRISDHK